MRQNFIDDLPLLDVTRYENFFDIYEDENKLYFYNLLKTVSFDQENLDPQIYTTYTVQPKDTYPYISYKKYKTINLWWLICALNNIQNPTSFPEPGTSLKILNIELVNNVLNNIS